MQIMTICTANARIRKYIWQIYIKVTTWAKRKLHSSNFANRF